MNIDILELYQAIFKQQGIQFLMLDDTFQNISKIDYELRQSIYHNYHYAAFISVLEQLVPDDPVLFFHDRLKISYCALLLPEKWQEEYQTKYIMIGPTLDYVCEVNEIKSIVQQNKIPQKHVDTCLEFFHRIPTITPQSTGLAMLRPLLQYAYGNSIQYRFLEFAPDSADLEQLIPDEDSSIPLAALENRYYIENQMLNAVSNGDNVLALDWYQKFTTLKIVPRSYDPIRNHKNMMVILNTLLRKTMERVNVHPYYIDQLSTEYAMKIERCVSMKQLDNLSTILIRKYCILAKNHSSHHYSDVIEKCIQYIDLNYQKNISVNILARYCSVTPNYLSSTFHQKTGKTLAKYINEIRIEHSILLLNTTNSPIQQIANQCGFPNANYYSRIFKKYKGITPLTYRKSIQS